MNAIVTGDTQFLNTEARVLMDMTHQISELDHAYRIAAIQSVTATKLMMADAVGFTPALAHLSDPHHVVLQDRHGNALGTESRTDTVTREAQRILRARMEKMVCETELGTEGMMASGGSDFVKAFGAKIMKVVGVATTIGNYKAHIAGIVSTVLATVISLGVGLDTDDILGAVLVGGTPDQYKAVIDRIGKIVTLSDDLGSLAAPKHANEADILAYQKDIRKHIHALQKQGVPINDEGGPKSMVSTAVDFFHSPYTKVKFSESGWTDEKIKNAIQDMKNLQQMVDKSQTTKPVISKDMDREIRRLEIVRMRAIARSQRYIISLLHKTNVLVRSLREHAKKTQQPKK